MVVLRRGRPNLAQRCGHGPAGPGGRGRDGAQAVGVGPSMLKPGRHGQAGGGRWRRVGSSSAARTSTPHTRLLRAARPRSRQV